MGCGVEMPAIKMIPEVCRIFCATANPVEELPVEPSGAAGLDMRVDGQVGTHCRRDAPAVYRLGVIGEAAHSTPELNRGWMPIAFLEVRIRWTTRSPQGPCGRHGQTVAGHAEITGLVLA